MSNLPIIVGIGEALLDLFPDQARLGGAPLNFTVHAHQLGNQGVVVSRIGQDNNGQLILDELQQRQMDTQHIQTDPDHMTGIVRIHIKPNQDHTFEIVNHVAWDNLQWDPDMESLALQARAVCFGSLAQRIGQTRNAIYRFLDSTSAALKLFDINLRQNFYNKNILQRSCEMASAVKCNIEELHTLNDLLHLGQNQDEIANALIKKFNLDFLAITQGPQGTHIYDQQQCHQTKPIQIDTSKGDAVGAGDAATAAITHGAIRGWDWQRTINLANELGAFVASQKGACPPLSDQLKQLL